MVCFTIVIRKLTEQEYKGAITKGDFDPPERTNAALILTQSWCPQWHTMRRYLEQAEKDYPEIAVAYLEYDTIASFEECMRFKENTYNNREIPYVRYFRNGVLSGESNYVPLEGFLHRLGLC